MTTTTEPAGLAELLADHSDDIQALFRRLRQAILTAVPELIERVYPGWHGLGFHHPDRGYLLAIFPMEDEVKVGFEYGAHLPDPYELLSGTGRRLRYLRFVPEGSGRNGPTEDHLIEYLDHALAQ
jgi:hypothetical protein